MTRSTRSMRSRVIPFALTLTLAGCASSAADDSTSTHPHTAGTAAAGDSPDHPAAAPLQLDDGWMKASTTGMTGLFGTLRNTSDRPVRVVRASTPLAAMVQLHETVKDPTTGEMEMREATRGFTVPPHGRFVLQPGANHIMLMELTQPLQPGDSARLALVDDQGRSMPVTVQVREFTGAQESYAPAGPSATHSSH